MMRRANYALGTLAIGLAGLLCTAQTTRAQAPTRIQTAVLDVQRILAGSEAGKRELERIKKIEDQKTTRLKEMEALEKIAEKVQYLAVHNGTRGLLEDLVSKLGVPLVHLLEDGAAEPSHLLLRCLWRCAAPRRRRDTTRIHKCHCKQ